MFSWKKHCCRKNGIFLYLKYSQLKKNNDAYCLIKKYFERNTSQRRILKEVN